MEEITNLISTANEAINSLESFIFADKKERYVTVKTITDYMKSQIEATEMVMESLEGENLDEIKEKLNTIIAKSNEVMEAFKTRDNIMVSVNENGEIVVQDINFENTQAPMETPAQDMSLSEDTYVDTMMKFPSSEGQIETEEIGTEVMPSAPAIEIIDDQATLEEHQAFAPEVQVAPESFEQIPEVSALDGMNTETPEQAVETDYSKDLDVAAVDAFLGTSESTLKL